VAASVEKGVDPDVLVEAAYHARHLSVDFILSLARRGGAIRHGWIKMMRP
jgi:hypothetical protein